MEFINQPFILRLLLCCFGIVSKYEINSNTHSGVKTQFSVYFIKTGKLDKSMAILFSELFDYRQKGDYGDFYDFEEKTVNALIPKVEQFIRKIERFTLEQIIRYLTFIIHDMISYHSILNNNNLECIAEKPYYIIGYPTILQTPKL